MATLCHSANGLSNSAIKSCGEDSSINIGGELSQDGNEEQKIVVGKNRKPL